MDYGEIVTPTSIADEFTELTSELCAGREATSIAADFKTTQWKVMDA